MKKILNIVLCFGLFSLIMTLASCYSPSPLYGKWVCKESDSIMNTITFMNDGTFSASIYDSNTSNYNSISGDYEVIDNVLYFEWNSGSNITTWQLDGAVLTLTWKIGGENKTLVLYHVSK